VHPSRFAMVVRIPALPFMAARTFAFVYPLQLVPVFISLQTSNRDLISICWLTAVVLTFHARDPAFLCECPLPGRGHFVCL